jgi:ADP-heptose:LPS heptosyltransferase
MMSSALAALRSMLPRAEIYITGNAACKEILADSDIRYLKSLDKRCSFEHTFIVNVPFSLLSPSADFFLRITTGYIISLHYNPLDGLHECFTYMKIPEFFGYRGELPATFCACDQEFLLEESTKRIAVLADTAKPDAVWQRKRWPYFRELAWILAKNYKIVLIGGKYEADNFDVAGWPIHYNFIGETNLSQTAALIKSASIFVGNDSGLAHISAAVGTKTFVLFGPTTMKKNKPLGKDVVCIASSKNCAPCQFTERWKKCDDAACMREIGIDEVLRIIWQNQE